MEQFIQKILALPVNASEHGGEIDFLIFIFHVLMLALFLGWGTFFIYSLVRFRKARNPRADYHGARTHTSTYLEVAVALFEAVLLIGISIPFWAKQVNALPASKDITEVHVIAEQFAWNIHYPGPDGVFGKTDIKYFDKQSNLIGLDPTDPHGKDDIVTINQLHLPVGKYAMIYLSSKDVVHSFSLPIMRVKQDVIPGMRIPTWFKPVKTGKSEIACAQLCGLGHYRMKGYLTVHTQEGFDKWLASQAAAQQQETGGDDFWN
jgi:cytochrome c oxidase subunit 2